MYLGIPKEILPEEHRVAAVPANVREYRRLGFDVLVERGAGAGVYVSDAEYREADAEIVETAAELYGRSDVVLKVKQPILNTDTGVHEVDLMKPGAVLVAFLHPAAPECHDMVRRLAKRDITSLTLDSLPRTLSYAQVMDALTSMSTVTGYRSILLAASAFPRFVPTIGTAIGANPPAKILVLGSGVVGLQAIATARRLGAAVSAVDIRPEAREQAVSLGATILGFEVPEEIALGEGGYSRALPAEWLAKEREALDPAVRAADIVIASALIPHERAPVLITEEMVSGMRPGSIIIDVAVDQGGNCQVTEAGRTVKKHGVTVCGTQNIPGGLAVDATRLFSQNMQHCVAHLFRDSRRSPDVEGEVGRAMLVTAGGRIVHDGTLRAMQEVEDAGVPAGVH